LGASVDALALAAALAQPWASTVLSGAATLAQLASNVAAVELAARDDVRAALEDLTAELAEPPDVYWTKRAALAWT
ncbi:aldo/keto reductase, partial [Myxococcota bacterium]|nr:aldo/keto reductase [Myxococcota bacterium]